MCSLMFIIHIKKLKGFHLVKMTEFSENQRRNACIINQERSHRHQDQNETIGQWSRTKNLGERGELIVKRRVQPQRNNQIEVLKVGIQRTHNYSDICLIWLCTTRNVSIVMLCIYVILIDIHIQSWKDSFLDNLRFIILCKICV